MGKIPELFYQPNPHIYVILLLQTFELMMSQHSKLDIFRDIEVDNVATTMKWVDNKAPKVLVTQTKSLDQLVTRVKEFREGKVLPKSEFFHFSKDLVSFWKFLCMIILPVVWLIITFQIVVQIFSGEFSSSFVLTLILLLILGLTFSSPILFLSRLQSINYLHEKDQLHLISGVVGSQEVSSDILRNYFTEKEEGLYWRQYQSNWDLSVFYPDFSILDVIGLVFSLFSLAFLSTWLVKILSVLSFGNRSNFRNAVLIIDIILLISFVGFVIIGIRYGLVGDWTLQWREKVGRRLISYNLILVSSGVIVSTIVERITNQFAGTAIFLILLLETPLIAAFFVNRVKLLITFNRSRIHLMAILNEVSANRIETIAKSDLSQSEKLFYGFLIDNDKLESLQNKNPLPATRIRSYTLVITALVSIVASFLTTFTASVELFTTIISSIFS